MEVLVVSIGGLTIALAKSIEDVAHDNADSETDS